MSMDISHMSEGEVHSHVRAALSTSSGRVLREFLRLHAFMKPTKGQMEWQSGEQVAFRYGRMTLFQILEYFENPENFKSEGADGP